MELYSGKSPFLPPQQSLHRSDSASNNPPATAGAAAAGAAPVAPSVAPLPRGSSSASITTPSQSNPRGSVRDFANNNAPRANNDDDDVVKSSSKKKKVIGSSYHFIPMMGRMGRHRRRNSSSDSDDDYDDGYGAGNGSNNSNLGRTNNNGTKKEGRSSDLSDRDALRDVFTQQRNNGTELDDNEGASSSSRKNANSERDGDETKWGNEDNDNIDGESRNQKRGPLHLHHGNDAANNGKHRGKKKEEEEEEDDDDNGPYTSRLGRRLWRQYRNQQRMERKTTMMGSMEQTSNTMKGAQQQIRHSRQHESSIACKSFPRRLPSRDFLRLPSTLLQIRNSTSNEVEWIDIAESERKVLQHHLDRESTTSVDGSREDEGGTRSGDGESNHTPPDSSFSSSSSVLASECFTRAVVRDGTVGLGISLREYDGCVYVRALSRCDGSRAEESAGEGTNETGGPAYKAGLLPGDRLLGLNGRPFLKGRMAATSSSSSSNARSNGVAATFRVPRKASTSEEVLKSVGDALYNAGSPMAIHIQRENDRQPVLKLLSKLSTEYKEKNVSVSKSPTRPTAETTERAVRKPEGPAIHPFAKALLRRSLIEKGRQELVVTRQLRVFTDRTRQWESKLSFRLRASDCTLRPLLDARDVEPTYYASFLTDDGECPPFFDYKFSKSIRSYAPSTPMIGDWRLLMCEDNGGNEMTMMMAAPPTARRVGDRMSREAAIMADLYSGLGKDDADVQDIILGGRNGASDGEGLAYPASAMQATSEPDDVFVPLVGIRKAICVRILNSFSDNRNRVAFTLWCYDVESGMEWYAPVRYYSDFKDLRNALLRVDKTIANIPFPSMGWSLGFSSEAKESAKTKEARRSQLEVFLRRVFAGVYRGRLHPYLAEVAVHLQTFVGCDTVLDEGGDSSLSLSKQVAISESSYGKRTPDPKSEPNNNARMHLKRSIQRYVYRLFLLPSVEQLISTFVDAAMKKVMTVAPGPSKPTSHQFKVDKGEATEDVEKIRDFIDQVQELILDGCHDDFVSMSQRRDFAALVDDSDNSIRDNLFREAVREQTELEVYVPLRSTISKYLVYAWFNEDMEMKHKMKALADKPQSYFRIPKEHRSRSDWKSVSRILHEGVGRSTLPCVKLRAVVDAAKEISQLDSEERTVFPNASFFDGKVDIVKSKTLGADDFLPIFIFCFVQAKIERPSALCELLSVMCDPRKMSGETGYYLASFHAALTHIHELDLTENDRDLSIIFDT